MCEEGSRGERGTHRRHDGHQPAMKLSLAALLFLLATVAAIAFTAGHTIAAMRWRPAALYSWDQKKLREDTDVRLDVCLDNLAAARAICEPPLAPVDWKGKP
jgi:hypothetical protein